MGDERMFPISCERGAAPHPTQIPWSVADLAYSVYSARYGKGQSLERLAERGGFGPGEMDTYLPGWREQVSEIASLRAEVERQRQRCRDWQDFCLRHPEILPPDPARELAEIRLARDAAERERDEARASLARVTEERDGARAAANANRDHYRVAFDRVQNLEAEVTRLREALVAMLGWHHVYHGSDDCVLCAKAVIALRSSPAPVAAPSPKDEP